MGETDATGAVIAHYFYLTRVNVPDFMVRKVSGVWQTFRLISDQAGSPKVLVQLTGGNPVVVERYDWDDWGVATATWPGAYHPFGFAGGIWDGSMGTYRFGAREYRPWEGRWWSKDASRFGGGLNFYVYCENDPVNYIDPTGHMPMDGSGAQERWSAYAVSHPDDAAIPGIVMAVSAIPVVGEVVDAFLLEATSSTATVVLASTASSAVCKVAGDAEDPFSEAAVRAAMADAPLATRQASVSMPVIRDYAARALAGDVAPAIKVADGVIIEGNHRYIAGRLVGIEPDQVEGVAWAVGRPIVRWLDVFLDPVDWGNR